jgi:L-threonylcarbamoyladenylate synthase
VVAPSANRSGHVSATRAEHVAEDLGAGVARVLDDGASPGGIESTVVDVGGPRPRLLRPGAVTAERLAEVLGRPIDTGADDAARPSSPGQLASHYAPSAAVRLEARDVRPGEALLAFGPGVPAHDGAMVNLSASGDLVRRCVGSTGWGRGRLL